jgi:metal-responsive CopG/Arc/MetJ family transcriptional regulator
MSKERKNATTIKVAIPDHLLSEVDARAKEESQFRSHWILDSIESRLNGTIGVPLKRCNIPLAVSLALKASNGKLTRIEAEHIVSKTIIALASDDPTN